MDVPTYFRLLRADGDRLAAVAELGLDTDVPSCPEWTVGDLVEHVGIVHRHKTQIVREGWRDGMPAPGEGPEGDVIGWYREGLAEMLEELSAHDPAEHVATWHDEDQSVGFWIRRMACETLVHRVDAELAHGVVTDLDPALATDALDEILTVMMTGYPEWGEIAHTDATVRIETTDTGAAWTLRLARFSGTSPTSGNTYEDEPTFVFTDVTDTTTVVGGAAEDLLLFLWGRRGREGLRIAGDERMLTELREVAIDVTQ